MQLAASGTNYAGQAQTAGQVLGKDKMRGASPRSGTSYAFKALSVMHASRKGGKAAQICWEAPSYSGVVQRPNKWLITPTTPVRIRPPLPVILGSSKVGPLSLKQRNRGASPWLRTKFIHWSSNSRTPRFERGECGCNPYPVIQFCSRSSISRAVDR